MAGLSQIELIAKPIVCYITCQEGLFVSINFFGSFLFPPAFLKRVQKTSTREHTFSLQSQMASTCTSKTQNIQSHPNELPRARHSTAWPNPRWAGPGWPKHAPRDKGGKGRIGTSSTTEGIRRISKPLKGTHKGLQQPRIHMQGLEPMFVKNRGSEDS